MKPNIKSLVGFTMGATDGEVGKVKEFYFDDHTWTIRYLIVETGSWLNHRKVLIAPEALLKPDWEHHIFPVNLTKEQIKNSPEIDTDKSVSRQHEIEIYKYYPWTSYWGAAYWGSGYYDAVLPASMYDEIQKDNNKNTDKDSIGDSHLRSTHKVKGYTIHAIDGEIGEVEDFIIDDSTWKLDFLVVDTGHWFPGKKVLISPNLIKEIDWDTSTVVVKATELEVKNSPEYTYGQVVNEIYKKDMDNYYAGLYFP